MKIKTSHVFPPIPLRQFDWCAWDDDRGEDCSPYGHGRTEEEAINDLMQRILEDEEAAQELEWGASA